MGYVLLEGPSTPAAPTGMEGIVNQLTTGVTSEGLFGTVGEIFPFIIVMIGFAFGYRVLRKVVKGASKGKATA